MVLVVPISLILGLALAVAAHRKLKGMAIYRVIFSSTVVSSVAVASVVFGTLLNPVVGLLPWLGINPNPPALESTTWALPAVALITIWQFLGLAFIIMLAGLQSVPDELLEAARIDGANAWTRFWRMTVPLLSPTIFFAVIVSTIYAMQAFGAIDILIGPMNTVRLHTNVLIYNIVNTNSPALGNNTGAGGHDGDGAVPHHARHDAAADAVPGAEGELCPLRGQDTGSFVVTDLEPPDEASPPRAAGGRRIGPRAAAPAAPPAAHAWAAMRC